MGEYRKDKPDFEDEKLRMWTQPKENAKDLIDEDAIKIKLSDGTEIMLGGFTQLKDKKTKELIFAYKIKHREKTLLYYVPKNIGKILTESEYESLLKVVKVTKSAAEKMSYEIKDVKEFIKHSMSTIKNNLGD